MVKSARKDAKQANVRVPHTCTMVPGVLLASMVSKPVPVDRRRASKKSKAAKRTQSTNQPGHDAMTPLWTCPHSVHAIGSISTRESREE